MNEQARFTDGKNFRCAEATAKLQEAEKNTLLAMNAISVLRQISERLPIPAGDPLLGELVALSRAQRRTLKAVHRLMEADPLLAVLLQSRVSYRRADEHRTKSGKRLKEMTVSTFFKAQAVGFRGGIEDWRALLGIYPSA